MKRTQFSKHGYYKRLYCFFNGKRYVKACKKSMCSWPPEENSVVSNGLYKIDEGFWLDGQYFEKGSTVWLKDFEEIK